MKSIRAKKGLQMINPSLDYKIQENDKTADVNKIDPTCT